jgi:E3 ubiquitin-protein ligase HUWE1
MLGQRVHYTDLEAIDPEYYKSLVWMVSERSISSHYSCLTYPSCPNCQLENDIEDYVELTFSVEPEEFGKSEIIDLKPNGRNIPVTNENKMEYVNLVAEQRLTSAIKSQIDAFLRGFHEVIPADLIKIFSDSELELLISGYASLIKNPHERF